MPRAYFTQFEIPYFNELTANQLDASTKFDAYTPVSHLGYSLGRINAYFQGNTGKPDIIEVIPGENGKPPASDNTTIDVRTGRAIPDDLETLRQQGVPIKPPDNITEQMGIDKNAAPSKCGAYDFTCQFNEFLQGDVAKDIGKRIGLGVVALVLLVLAVVSLR